MGTEYDSRKIRRLAGQIGGIADAVSNVKHESLRKVRREMPENFQGAAATALQDSLDDLEADIHVLGRELCFVRSALLSLADRVDAADRAARELIQRR